jgi:catecholate siderophore receptor
MSTRSFVPRRAPFTWSPQAFYLTTLGMVISGAMSCNAWGSDVAVGDPQDPPPAPDAPQTAVTLGPIKVTGANVESVHDIPQAIDTISQETMTEQGVMRVQDALRNVPGITLNAGEGGQHGDSINLRGLSVPDSFFLDGIRDLGTYERDSFNLESVAVLKGPSSVLFGRGSTAGVINQVSKTPDLTTSGNASLTGGSNDSVRFTGDFNTALGPATAARINVMDERSDVAGRDYVLNRRSGIAPSIEFGIGTPTRLTLSYFHQEENNIPDYGFPFIGDSPANVRRQNYYGLLDYDRTKTNVNISTIRFEHDFSADTTFSNSLRYGDYQSEYKSSTPFLGNDFVDPPPPGTPLEDILVSRDQPSSKTALRNLIDQANISSRFDTGSFTHLFIAGVELSHENSDITRWENGLDVIPPTPLLHPDPHEVSPQPLVVDSLPHASGDDASAYLVDTVKLSPHWDVTGGLRWDRFKSEFEDDLLGTRFQQTYVDLAPRGAVIFKPTVNQSYYLSYGTSYNPAIEYLTLAPSSSAISPEKNKTYELGAKIDAFNNEVNFTAAIFKTDLTNARNADPDDPTVQDLPFDETVKGLELGFTGHLTANWKVDASYTHLLARISNTTDPDAVGKEVPNVPHNALTLWTTWRLDPAWKISGGFSQQSWRFADTHDIAHVPGYVLFNAMAEYELNDHFELRLNLNNLANKLYFRGVYYVGTDENHAIPGAGRTALLTASVSY